MRYAILPQRGLIEVSGEESFDFLQGLITNNMSRAQESPIYAALLSPQGRFQHDFFIIPWQGSVLLDADKVRLPELLQRLTLYRLRARVQIKILPHEMGVAVTWDGAAVAQHSGFKTFADPRLAKLGYRMVGDINAIRATCDKEGMESDEDADDLMRLELGVPEGERDMIIDKSLLLEFGFEDLHGVDFAKGCYVGQEVTARSKHRGQMRKFIYQVRGKNGVLPGPGETVFLGDKEAGEMRSSLGDVGLALLRVEEMEQAQKSNMSFHCGHITFTAALPEWVTHSPKALAVEG